MATKAKELTKKDRALSAIQLSALRVLEDGKPHDLNAFGLNTRRALTRRKLVDMLGRAGRLLSPTRYLLTPFGRTVLAARTRHEGRARR
jgi:hypothetical protein